LWGYFLQDSPFVYEWFVHNCISSARDQAWRWLGGTIINCRLTLVVCLILLVIKCDLWADVKINDNLLTLQILFKHLLSWLWFALIPNQYFNLAEFIELISTILVIAKIVLLSLILVHDFTQFGPLCSIAFMHGLVLARNSRCLVPVGWLFKEAFIAWALINICKIVDLSLKMAIVDLSWYVGLDEILPWSCPKQSITFPCNLIW